jgi:transposase-like protein
MESQAASSAPPGTPPTSPAGFHGAVVEFKRRLIEATLTQLGGNRTRTARALGLQRTYLLRLMREFGIRIPPAAMPAAARAAESPERPPAAPVPPLPEAASRRNGQVAAGRGTPSPMPGARRNAAPPRSRIPPGRR